MIEYKFRAKYAKKTLDWFTFTLEELVAETVWLNILDRKTIGQYTGIIDKNSIEICEGDIVFHKWRAENGLHEMVIEIGSDDCPLNDCGWINERDQWDNIDNEILGNVYDNPELRERVKF